MAKKRVTPVRGLSEREATREYVHALRDVYQERGLLSAIGYEVKSTLYSLRKRIANLFDRQPSYDSTSTSTPFGVVHHRKTRLEMDLGYAAARRREERIAERHGYILRGKKKSNLESVATEAVAIIGIVSGLALLSPNITGNAIGSLTTSTSSIIGAILFVVGLVGGFFWMRQK